MIKFLNPPQIGDTVRVDDDNCGIVKDIIVGPIRLHNRTIQREKVILEHCSMVDCWEADWCFDLDRVVFDD